MGKIGETFLGWADGDETVAAQLFAIALAGIATLVVAPLCAAFFGTSVPVGIIAGLIAGSMLADGISRSRYAIEGAINSGFGAVLGAFAGGIGFWVVEYTLETVWSAVTWLF